MLFLFVKISYVRIDTINQLMFERKGATIAKEWGIREFIEEFIK